MVEVVEQVGAVAWRGKVALLREDGRVRAADG